MKYNQYCNPNFNMLFLYQINDNYCMFCEISFTQFILPTRVLELIMAHDLWAGLLCSGNDAFCRP